MDDVLAGSRIAFAAAALVAGGLAGPLSAGAAEGPPVHLTFCRTIVEPHSRGAPAQEAIQVSFSNDRDSPADIARFTVRSGTGRWKQFTARGSFSKGIIIADRILPSETAVEVRFFGREQTADCALTYVHFADGSSWTTPR